MRKASVTALALVMALAGGTLAACEEEGPAERAGEKIDKAVEKTGDAIGDAGREIERKTD